MRIQRAFACSLDRHLGIMFFRFSQASQATSWRWNIDWGSLQDRFIHVKVGRCQFSPANKMSAPLGPNFFSFSIPFVQAFAIQSLVDSTHVCLQKINTVRNVNVILVDPERLVHRANQHHLNLTMHNVGQDGSREFHAEDDEQQQRKLCEGRWKGIYEEKPTRDELLFVIYLPRWPAWCFL